MNVFPNADTFCPPFAARRSHSAVISGASRPGRPAGPLLSSERMSSRRGFTLIEMSIVFALIAIVATAAFSTMNASRRNANVNAVVWELALELQGQRAAAIGDQRDRLVVVVDAPGNDATSCSVVSPADCTRVFYLQQPAATWTLADFDPSAPDVAAGMQDWRSLPAGVRLHLAGTGAPAPRPFGNPTTPSAGVRVFDADLTGTCGDRTCFAIRFRASGEVTAERAVVTAATKTGFAFAVSSDLTGSSGGAAQYGAVVAFPAGIVKTFSL
jgi:prepilin-type N-terminal cleavage/methylation domain-containing protein